MLTRTRFDLKDQIKPLIFFPTNSLDWEEIQELRSSNYVQTIDEIDSQVIDLIKSDHPENQFSKDELNIKVVEFF